MINEPGSFLAALPGRGKAHPDEESSQTTPASVSTSRRNRRETRREAAFKQSIRDDNDSKSEVRRNSGLTSQHSGGPQENKSSDSGWEINPSCRQKPIFLCPHSFALICLSQPCKLLKARQRQSRVKHPVGRSYLQCNCHFDCLPPLSCSCASSFFPPSTIFSLSRPLFSFSFFSPSICRCGLLISSS